MAASTAIFAHATATSIPAKLAFCFIRINEGGKLYSFRIRPAPLPCKSIPSKKSP